MIATALALSTLLAAPPVASAALLAARPAAARPAGTAPAVGGLAGAVPAAAAAAAGPFAEDWDDPPYDGGAEEPDARRVRLALWGGTGIGEGGSGRTSTLWGAEAAWSFESLDLGVAGYGYESLVDAERRWTPVVLARLTQRFRTRRDVEAAFTFGVGAGRPQDWDAWFQVALGVRANLGPMFLAGEIAFESQDLLRLAAGVGVAF